MTPSELSIAAMSSPAATTQTQLHLTHASSAPLPRVSSAVPTASLCDCPRMYYSMLRRVTWTVPAAQSCS
jgi:hypothetical protein